MEQSKQNPKSFDNQSLPISTDSPQLVFGDLQGNPINEIILAPGEQQTIRVILFYHPEDITMGFLAQWTMFDSNHKPTGDVICTAISPDDENWLSPLGLSTQDISAGGTKGNELRSNNPQPGLWVCLGNNNDNNQFWSPSDEFYPPVAVAEFNIKAPDDWKDEFATFELDTEQTEFIMASETDADIFEAYEAMCDYNMALTIRNKNAISANQMTEAPKISSFRSPDGANLNIFAEGEGNVRLVVDDNITQTGNNSSIVNLPYKEGVTHTAKACIVDDGGNPISEWASKTITIPTVVSITEQHNTPYMLFADEDGTPLSELALAPGEQKTVHIILAQHAEVITRAFQAQWIMYDSNHQLTNSITCKKIGNKNNWISPLGLSTCDESVGGLEGNTMLSAEPETGTWRCICTNPKTNQFWFPRDQFTPPIAVAKFTLQAPNDWSDEYATFELDSEYTSFFLTSDPSVRADRHSNHTVKCDYSMVLTIKNKNIQTVSNKPNPITEHHNTPYMLFANEDGSTLSELVLAPGEHKKVHIILAQHAEVITKAFQAQWNMYDSNQQPTNSITCKKIDNRNNWISPLGLSTCDESVGGLEGNIMQSAECGTGIWRCIGANPKSNQFWFPRDQFTPPIAVAKFTLQAPSDWSDKYATFELDTDFTSFVMTSDTAIPADPHSNHSETCDYSMVLTIKNKKRS